MSWFTTQVAHLSVYAVFAFVAETTTFPAFHLFTVLGLNCCIWSSAEFGLDMRWFHCMVPSRWNLVLLINVLSEFFLSLILYCLMGQKTSMSLLVHPFTLASARHDTVPLKSSCSKKTGAVMWYIIMLPTPVMWLSYSHQFTVIFSIKKNWCLTGWSLKFPWKPVKMNSAWWGATL